MLNLCSAIPRNVIIACLIISGLFLPFPFVSCLLYFFLSLFHSFFFFPFFPDFYNLVPLMRRHLSNHLLWSVFQSSYTFTHYKFSMDLCVQLSMYSLVKFSNYPSLVCRCLELLSPQNPHSGNLF